MEKIIFLILILCSIYSINSQVTPDLEKQTLDTVLTSGKHDLKIRPNNFNRTDGATKVELNMFVRNIVDVNEIAMQYKSQITFRQKWNDPRLRFNSEALKYVTLTDPERIWIPDTFFPNEISGNFHQMLKPNSMLRIYQNGDILYSLRVTMVFSCPMDMTRYPHDSQECTIRMASYGYTSQSIIYEWKSVNPVQITPNLNLPNGFRLTHHSTEECTSKTNTGTYSCLQVKMHFKRDCTRFVIGIYLPTIFLIIVSWLSFWIDHQRTSSKMVRTSLLMIVIFMMALLINGQKQTSTVSYYRSIDIWNGVSMLMIFSALVEFIIVHIRTKKCDHHHQHHQMKLEENIIDDENDQTLNCKNDKNQPQTKDGRCRFEWITKKWYPNGQCNGTNRIDQFSRILFPLIFIVFIIYYCIINLI
ncbi:Glycine receptor subunit alpha-3 [Blomia tropicalis]|nr:Glycine receptor subunit alpha-3 [Blomia tropicalis]